MTTISPLPDWRDFAAVLKFGQDLSPCAAKPWAGTKENAWWFSGSTWAIGAVTAWLSAQIEGRPIKVWFPEYFCNQSTFAVRSQGAAVIFYRVNADLRPDWEFCNRLREIEKCDLFILPHYFGADCGSGNAIEFCLGANAVLLEDAAHILIPHGRIGRDGDFVTYSPHKLLPIPDGAVLIENTKSVNNFRDPFTVKLQNSAPAVYPWILKRLIQKILPISVHQYRNRRLPNFSWSPLYRQLPQNPASTKIGRQMLYNLHLELPVIAQRRKLNAKHWRSCLAAVPAGRCTPLFSEVEEGPAPYRFVLRYGKSAEAEGDYNRLRSIGCPVETWPDLAPEVALGGKSNGTAKKLRGCLIFLPVHGGVSLDAIARYAAIIARASI